MRLRQKTGVDDGRDERTDAATGHGFTEAQPRRKVGVVLLRPRAALSANSEVRMALMAVAFPIAPGQSAQWHTWMNELKGARRAEFVASRRAASVRERTFLQATPMGELVIVTLEGDDPMASFGKMMSEDDEFTRWFVAQANAAHGMDLSQPASEAPSSLVLDSEGT